MGYTTDFSGAFSIAPSLEAKHRAYLRRFCEMRHMSLKPTGEGLKDPIRKAVGLPFGREGEFCTVMLEHGQPEIIDYNEPPLGVPGLWCQWEAASCTTLQWDGGEKFYNYVEWLEYLIEHFFRPWGYELNGQIEWTGEDRDDRGTIGVRRNEVRTHEAPVYEAPGLDALFADDGTGVSD